VITFEGKEEVSILGELAYEAEVEQAKTEKREPLLDRVRSMVTENDAFAVFKGILSANPIGALPVMAVEQSMLVGLADMEADLGHIKTELQKEKAELEEKQKGQRVGYDWKSDGRHIQYLSYEDIRESLKIWEKFGLEGSADLKIIEFYAEPESGFSKKDSDRGVIVSRVMDKFTIKEFRTWINRQVEKLEDQDAKDPLVVEAKRHYQHAVAYINKAYNNPNNNPEKDIVMIQKIEVRHPLATDTINNRIVWSYMPDVMVEGLKKSGRLQALFTEIPTNHKATVIKMLEEARVATKDKPLEPSFELAASLLKDGVLHEDYHEKIYKHTKEDLERAKELLVKLPRGRIFFKNFIKALSGIQYFRLVEKSGDENFAEPSDYTWDLALRLFLEEMICDLIPIQLKRRAGEQHVYESELGETLSPEWETFLNELIDRHIDDFKKGESGIYKKEQLLTSGYYKVRGVNASLLAPTSLAESMASDGLAIGGLTLPNITRPKIEKVEVGAQPFNDASLLDMIEKNETEKNGEKDENSLLSLVSDSTSEQKETEDSNSLLSELTGIEELASDTEEHNITTTNLENSTEMEDLDAIVSAEASFDNVATEQAESKSMLARGFEPNQTTESAPACATAKDTPRIALAPNFPLLSVPSNSIIVISTPT